MDGTTKEPVVVDNVIYNADALVATWMHERMGETRLVETGFVALGVLDPTNTSPNISDKLVCGVYFFNHRDVNDEKDICIAVAIKPDAFVHPKSIKRMFQYPFRDLGLPRISAEADMSNEGALRGLQQMGFVLEGTKKYMAKGRGDFGVFGLYPANCPFWSDGV